MLWTLLEPVPRNEYGENCFVSDLPDTRRPVPDMEEPVLLVPESELSTCIENLHKVSFSA